MTKLIAIAPLMHTDTEIRPPHKCFCCGDAGTIESIFLAEFVEGHNSTKFICKRSDCEAGAKYRNAYKLTDFERDAFAKKYGGDPLPARVYQRQFDYRLSAEHCEQIHIWEREVWAKTLAAQQAASKKLQTLLENI